jgi:hypothetical protein
MVRVVAVVALLKAVVELEDQQVMKEERVEMLTKTTPDQELQIEELAEAEVLAVTE